MKVSKPLIVGAVVATATGIAFPTLGASGNKYAATESQRTCTSATGEDGTVTLVGPLKLWPPNHKMIDEPVTAQRTVKPGTSVTLTLTPTVDDATGGDGGPQHDPDFNATSSDGKTFVADDTAPDGTTHTGTATAAFQLRAERSGKGDGRTYTINWSVDWGNGDTCSSSDSGQTPFTVTVPHDMSGGQDFSKP